MAFLPSGRSLLSPCHLSPYHSVAQQVFIHVTALTLPYQYLIAALSSWEEYFVPLKGREEQLLHPSLAGGTPKLVLNHMIKCTRSQLLPFFETEVLIKHWLYHRALATLQPMADKAGAIAVTPKTHLLHSPGSILRSTSSL